MNPKQRGFLIEEILNNSALSVEERATLIFDHICQTSEDEDEVISMDIIKEAFSQMRKKTFRGFRSAVLMAIADKRELNVFAVNRNLIRMDHEPRVFKNDPVIEKIVKTRLKIPLLN